MGFHLAKFSILSIHSITLNAGAVKNKITLTVLSLEPQSQAKIFVRGRVRHKAQESISARVVRLVKHAWPSLIEIYRSPILFWRWGGSGGGEEGC
jgi:hypothetical protein